MGNIYPGTGREVLLFTSYCGNHNPDCTNRRPCPICLGMSNVVRILPDGKIEHVREFSPDWNADLQYRITTGGTNDHQ